MTAATDRRVPTRTAGRCAVIGQLGLAAGCGLVDGHFTPEQWEIIETLSPREAIPDDPTNAFADTPEAAQLGHALFFDRRLSTAIVEDIPADEGGLGEPGEEGLVACADCHDPANYFADVRAKSIGVAQTPRNAPSVLDVARWRWFLWDGGADSLWQTITVAVEAGKTQNSNRLKIAHLLHDDPDYALQYEAVFGPFPPSIDTWPANGKPSGDDSDAPSRVGWESLDEEQRHLANEVFANFGKAVAAYCRLLVTGDAPFDAYVAGDHDAIDDAAKRGLALFVGKAGCIECHNGPNFTDHEFHNIGLDQGEREVDDMGRWTGLDKLMHDPFNSAGPYSDLFDGGPLSASVVAPVRRERDKGAFRTSSLRNVAETAPYMHDGSLATLEDVVAHYKWGADDGGYPGQPHPMLRQALELSAEEQADIVAFLETLTGDEPKPSLREEP